MEAQFKPQMPTRDRGPKDGKLIFGLIVAGLGILMMLHVLHILPWYTLHMGWPVILIVIGLVIGLKSNFRKNAWWILILIGAANLTPAFYIGDVPSTKLVWPAMIILLGLAIVFRNNGKKKWEQRHMEFVTNGESSVNVDVTFGGRKEIVTSKEFRGGSVSATFGGVELNLMQADCTTQPMVLDIKVSFGGVEIVAPSYWEIQNQINPSFGSVEDRRMTRTPDAGMDKKILVLRGDCSFGSIEIKSY